MSPSSTDAGSAERHLRLAMKVIGLICCSLYPVVWADRTYFGAQLGYAWSPDHYDEPGNTTWEFELMIFFTYGALGLCLILCAATEPDLSTAKWFLDFCIWGAFGAHATSMLYSALTDWDREWGHVMPYGDVTALFAFAIILFVLKRRFLFKQE